MKAKNPSDASDNERELERLTGIPVDQARRILRNVVLNEGGGSVDELTDFLRREIPRLLKSQGLRQLYIRLTEPISDADHRRPFRRSPRGRVTGIKQGRIDGDLLYLLAAAYYRIESAPPLGSSARINPWLRTNKEYTGTIYELPDNPYARD